MRLFLVLLGVILGTTQLSQAHQIGRDESGLIYTLSNKMIVIVTLDSAQTTIKWELADPGKTTAPTTFFTISAAKFTSIILPEPNSRSYNMAPQIRLSLERGEQFKEEGLLSVEYTISDPFEGKKTTQVAFNFKNPESLTPSTLKPVIERVTKSDSILRPAPELQVETPVEEITISAQEECANLLNRIMKK